MKTARLSKILTILAVTTLVAACSGGGGGGSNSISPPPEPELVILAGNINGAVITDANGQEFAITAKGPEAVRNRKASRIGKHICIG